MRWLLGLAALCWATLAAGAPAERTTRTLALVVANNRSLSLQLPDLQYADDDAARYHRLFRAAGDGARVELLTSFDRTSARFYPQLAELARPATRAELLRAVSRLKQAIDAAHAKGERVALYFVFAGHGEVAGGRGYLHLEDTRIDGAFIEREIIARLKADAKHVLLDSCNSFFVINPRKPGGRRWATPKDMALGFSARHPEVGLFLSTNSDEEVYEWSELESGVFSHEVRSGLTGAADVDGNGVVTYAELGGFVAQANQGIARENLRPQVYFSGPRGDQHAGLFRSSALAGRKVTLRDGRSRLWVRGGTGERLVDLHKEPGPLTITLPGVPDEDIAVFEQSDATPPVIVERRFAAGIEPIRLQGTSGEPPRLAARGDQLFGSLFASPYGPRAYDTYLRGQQREPEPVYGVKDDDVTRMGNYLTALADVDRMQRSAMGVTFTATGGLLAASAVVGRFSDPKLETAPTIGFAAAGAAFAGTGLYLSLTESEGEKALAAFKAELWAQRGNRARAFAHTEQKLQDVARAERSRRQFSFWMLQALGLAFATAGTIGVMTEREPEAGAYALVYGSAALMSGLGFYVLSVETPTERLLRLYRDDPGFKVNAGVSPLPAGGLGLSLYGSF